MREVERVLEGGNLIVQKVETENDVGRDAYVDIVEGTDVTGGVVALQVKSGVSFHQGGQWVIPGNPEDFTLWRESSVPMFGVVHDPRSGYLRWTNLSSAALIESRSIRGDAFRHEVIDGAYGKRAVVVPEDNRLDLDVAGFVRAAVAALRQHKRLPAHELLSNDVQTVEGAITDSFALGRRDSRAFLLLAALIPRLPPETHRLAVEALAMAARHPDVFWTRDNWIPSEIKSEVAGSCRWTAEDVHLLLGLVDEAGIERGTFGQHVFHVLELDSGVDRGLHWVATDARYELTTRFWAAAILLHRAGSEAPDSLGQLLTDSPDLGLHAQFAELIHLIRDYGYVPLFYSSIGPI